MAAFTGPADIPPLPVKLRNLRPGFERHRRARFGPKIPTPAARALNVRLFFLFLLHLIPSHLRSPAGTFARIAPLIPRPYAAEPWQDSASALDKHSARPACLIPVFSY